MVSRVGPFLLSWALVSGCTSEWRLEDVDGDGFTVADGDCWEQLEGPEGSSLGGAQIFPGAGDIWYDGVDQNCDAADDFDADGDGYVPAEYEGVATVGVEGSGALPGGDCWDDPSSVPDEMAPLNGLYDAGGAYAAAGYSAPDAPDVNPGQAEDLPYDGIDADCAGADADGSGADDDFDVDGDGFLTSFYDNRDGAAGEDCIDCGDSLTACLAEDNPAEIDPAQVNPAIEETWYDGTDQDCDTNDCDADGDSYPASGGDSSTEFCTLEDCDDTDENRFPDGSVETWYDGIDNNCDLLDGDGDKDGDLYWADDYADLVNANPDKLDDPMEIPAGYEGDCDDSGDDLAADNGFGDITSADVNPGATERYYDSIDQNCDEANDYDWDGDGYTTSYAVDSGGGLGSDCNDCDLACDNNACDEYAIVCSNENDNPGIVPPDEIFPNASETWYDGTDQDCLGEDSDGNGSVDDYDVDADGYESELEYTGGTDCDDNTDTTNPGVNEDCNTSADDDCDGNDNDDGATDCTTYYGDDDGDGQGDSSDSMCFCVTEDTYTTTNSQDCDDDESTIYYGATELCDGQVNNCASSALPADESDADSDGYVECTEDSGGWDGDAITGDEDCDDSDDTVYPSASELCDGQDNDCDGSQDSTEDDDDSDGYVECTVDSGGWDGSSISGGDDCDDSEDTVYPTASELCDGQYNDCDDSSYSASSAPSNETDNDSDGYVECTVDSGGWDGSSISGGDDCDDAEDTIYTGATELCDGQINDCDTASLPDDESDLDGDGYSECEWDSGGWDGSSSVVGEDDCDDTDDERSPGLTEVCDDDNKDEDCDGDSDDEDSSVDTASYDTWYYDGDGDGHVTSSASTVSQCETPTDPAGDAQYLLYADLTTEDDCDDTDADISPEGQEVCDAANADEDCDGDSDDDDSSATGQTTFYADTDGDGYGDLSNSADYCDQPSGYETDSEDCDDDDSAINPGATEVCDASDTDEDCSGAADDDDSGVDASTEDTWYYDADGDGYVPSGASTTDACDEPSAIGDAQYIIDTSVPADADCDDTDEDVNPAATEICDDDDTDEDCNGTADDDDSGATGQSEYYYDGDGDTYGDASVAADYCDPPSDYVSDDTDCDDSTSAIAPDQDETCDDGIDNDCNSSTTCAIAATLSDASLIVDSGQTGISLGTSVLLIDHNGDTYDDLIMGATENTGSKGEVYVLGGATSATAPSTDGGSFTQGTRDLSSSSDYDELLSGATGNDEFGGSLASAGDQNGDGYEDLLVGAIVGDTNATNAGDVYLFHGPLTTASSSTYDYVFEGTTASDYSGTSMAAGFDFNNDLDDDLVIGAPGDTPSPGNGVNGAAYLFIGAFDSATQTSADLDDADVSFTGNAADDMFGFSIAAGDVDGDGVGDVLVGAPYADDGGQSSGSSYVFLGASSSPGATVAGDADALYMGASAGDRGGWSVHIAELSGDSYDDIIITADGDDDGGSASGVVYVVYGAATVADATLSSTDAAIAGTEAGDRAGWDLDSGDVDGDGQLDLLVSSVNQDTTGGANAGGVALFFGPVSGSLTMDGGDGLSIGEAAGDDAGNSISTGDVDADGQADFLIGAPGVGADDGAAYLILGVAD